MNYREKIRKAIACPQFGDTNYGEWGALRLDQRKLIKRLLDELDGADNYISYLHKNIDKAIEYMEEYNEYVVPDANIKSLILKEEYKKIIEILGDKENE